MEHDHHGLAVTGSAGFAERYSDAVGRLLRFGPDFGTVVDTLAADFPDAPLAQVLSAYVALGGTDPRDHAAAGTALAAAPHLSSNAREQAHLAAAAAWVAGDMLGAGAILDRLLIESPRDALAVYFGHQIDFLTGNARHLRDRIARTLHAYSPTDDAYGFLLGMMAFGIEECGDYQRAMAFGTEAIERHPNDVWAVHAIVHCHEMQGDAVGGLAFLDRVDEHWSAGNGFTVHNNWHAALFELTLDRLGDVLTRYDRSINNTESSTFPMELLDATSLLWRLHLRGDDVGDRWTRLAAGWDAVGTEPLYAFNDMHAVMALIGDGRVGEARSFAERRADWIPNVDNRVTNRSMTSEVGLPVCRGLVAFAEDRYDDCIQELLGSRPVAHRFGGSHAQRDVIDLTIIEAARRTGNGALGAALTSERQVRAGTFAI